MAGVAGVDPREARALIIRGAVKSDTGRVRRENEDAYGFFPDLSLFIVADGVGGHVAGATASLLTVEAIRRSLVETQDAELTPATAKGGLRSVAARRLVIALETANERVRDACRNNPRIKGMGTTAAAVLFDRTGGVVAIVHVGDTRVYRIRAGQIEQLTEDHTLAQALIQAGKLSPAELHASPHRHMLTRAVGADDVIAPDLRLEQPNVGDVFLLSSDGVHDVVSAEEIAAAVRTAHPDLERACTSLIDLANQRGGHDNSTVLIVTCDGPTGAAPGAPP
jgi:protein phosphatase